MRALRRLERGQAMLEYAAIIPGAILISIVAAAALGPAVSSMFQQTVDGVNRVSCEAPSLVTELENATIEVASYIPSEESTTISFKLTASPDAVIGLDEDIADKVIYTSEDLEIYDTEKRRGCNNGVGNGPDCLPNGLINNGRSDLDNDDGEGDAPGNPGNRGGNKDDDSKSNNGRGNNKFLFLGEETDETRFIVITLSGFVAIEDLDVTVKSGETVAVGSIQIPTITDEGC